jgi:hypothetical protein
MRPAPSLLVLFLAAGGLAGCGTTASNNPEEGETADLPVGDLDDLGVKADGWGAALNCKPIPNVPGLANPEIVISLDGLTLHLRDKGGTYDRVFPIGPGAIENGKSLTPPSTGTTGTTFFTSADTREYADGGWGYYYPCKIWWTDADTKEKKPVFAGLPFIRLVGPPTAAYAIHGPVDGFSLPSGGNLRRGFVSHGCTRMAAADIVEVYARIHNHPKTPVRIQKEIERAGGVCRPNPYGASFCSKACTASCPDKTGYVGTRCVPDGQGQGFCAISSDKVNNFCANQNGRVAKQSPLFGRTGTTNVCLPGSKGVLGASCRADGECGRGNFCQPSGLASGPGFCSASCTATCAAAGTVCTKIGTGGRCVPTCWGQDVCSAGLACEDGVARLSGGTAHACVPGGT